VCLISLTQSAPVGGVAAFHNCAVVALAASAQSARRRAAARNEFFERLLTSHRDLAAAAGRLVREPCHHPLFMHYSHSLSQNFPPQIVPLAGVALALGLTSLTMAFAVGHISGAISIPR
jgi:hypothetical protein